ncbi:MAG: XRE family transcriptional regulator [Proteobacteria bacterium]|nr:MAG: XRE family transcriptional regulator [Pseudomonadota bacterium]
MSKKSESPKAISAQVDQSNSLELEMGRRVQIGAFFRERRELAGLEADYVAKELDLESSTILHAYESGRLSIPVDDVFAMTNILNIPPEDVMELIHELYQFGVN